MKTTHDRSTNTPLTVAIPAHLLVRTKILCQARGETLSRLVTDLLTRAVSNLDAELRDRGLVGADAPQEEA